MYVRNLTLTDFRSYAACSVELPPGPVVLVGPNGAGKTNLVEAVGYLATLGSHRVATDAPLVRQGSGSAHVSAVLVRELRSVRLDVQINAGRANRAWVNRSAVRRPRDVLGYARVVTFAPEDVAIVRGDPEDRRRCLDEVLVLRWPRLAGVRADFDRALRQRNALLRGAAEGRGPRGEPAGLQDWDEALAVPAAEIVAARTEMVAELGPRMAAVYADIAPGRGHVTLDYRSSVRDRLAAVGTADVAPQTGAERPSGPPAPPGPDDVLSALRAARREELARGVTVVGPHRDDLLVGLAGRPAKGYASHGETWSLVLSLRLASFELLRDQWGDTPVLVLDDVFAELDASRRAQLAELAGVAEQVVVTAAVIDDVPDVLRAAQVTVGEGAGEGSVVAAAWDGSEAVGAVTVGAVATETTAAGPVVEGAGPAVAPVENVGRGSGL